MKPTFRAKHPPNVSSRSTFVGPTGPTGPTGPVRPALREQPVLPLDPPDLPALPALRDWSDRNNRHTKPTDTAGIIAAMDDNPQMEDGPLYRQINFSGTFVKAEHFDRLREDYDRLVNLIPEGLRDQVAVAAKDAEHILRGAYITPTIEACDAFRIGLAQGIRQASKKTACKCGGDCACGKDKFGGSE